VIIIRPARKEDATAIRAVVITVSKEEGVYNPVNPKNDISDIIEAYHNQSGEFFVAEYEGRIIGTIGFHPIDRDFAKLRRFYVLSAFRGRGIGKALLNRVIRLCKKKGHMAIVSISPFSLKRAFEVYSRAGFKVFKTTKLDNYLIKPLGEYELDFPELAKRDWIFIWKDSRWQHRNPEH
jgi:putative acetyltransferase